MSAAQFPLCRFFFRKEGKGKWFFLVDMDPVWGESAKFVFWKSYLRSETMVEFFEEVLEQEGEMRV